MAPSLHDDPTRWIDVWRLADGRRVSLRPMLPQDAALQQAMVRALSPASRYQRFFAPIRELPEAWLERLTHIDDRLTQALIVEGFDQGRAQAVAEARYVVDGGAAPMAEFAVVVADAWQRQGLARRLLCTLLRMAAEQGLQRLYGDVLATNQAMLQLARSLGFTVRRHPDGGATVLRVERAVDPAAAAPQRASAAAMASSAGSRPAR
jgi:acetyltransferase